MSAPMTDEDFAAFAKAWDEWGGCPRDVAEATGKTEREVYRVRALAAKRGFVLTTRRANNGSASWGWQEEAPKWPKRREVELLNGALMVGSDAHFWPGMVTTAWKAFCKVAEVIKPKMVIMNGDTLDGARISRHDPIAWERRPKLDEELDCCKERLGEIEAASPGAEHLKTAGNHDTRFERYLAKNVPEMRDVRGSCLQDHLGWPMAWSILINQGGSPLMVKHAFRGGIHAVYNNTLHAGVSICTGHLHAQLVRPFTDYRGTRYGVDCGTLADITGPQFHYTMDAPVNWRSGFAVFTFDDHGFLLPPELCEVQTFPNGYQRAVFRGEVVATGETFRDDIAA